MSYFLNSKGVPIASNGGEGETNKVSIDMVDGLEERLDSLGSDSEEHKSNKDNPHKVTKEQVGLGEVQNYGVATTLSAEAGSAQNEYMTPFLTKKLLDKNVVKSDSVTSTSSETLATSSAVKAVMDKANSAYTVAEDALDEAEHAQTMADGASSSINSHAGNKASDSSYSHVKTTSSVSDLVGENDVALVPTAKLLGEVITTSNNHATSLVTNHGAFKGDANNSGHVKLNSSTSSSQSVRDGVCATPLAVKTAYDKARSAETKADEAFQLGNKVKSGLLDALLPKDYWNLSDDSTFEEITQELKDKPIFQKDILLFEKRKSTTITKSEIGDFSYVGHSTSSGHWGIKRVNSSLELISFGKGKTYRAVKTYEDDTIIIFKFADVVFTDIGETYLNVEVFSSGEAKRGI